MTRNPAIERALAAIDETAWTPVRYPGAVQDPDTGAWISDAEVAEIAYTAFASTPDRITARLVVRRVKDARFADALFPVWRYHPFFTNTDAPVEQADITHRQHAIIETVFADLIDGPLAHLPVGPIRRELRLDPVRRDRPQPAARGRCPRRRGAHPSTRIDAAPQDRQRCRPTGPTATPPDPAPTHPLALVQSLACTVAQHHRIQPTTERDTLTTRRKARPERTGKAGQTSSYPTPTPQQSRSTKTRRLSPRFVGGSRLSHRGHG